MPIIHLTCRHVIDASHAIAFEKAVWQLSYEEFKLKAQAYNPEGKWDRFTQLKTADGRANSLHYKTGFAISGWMNTLQQRNPFLRDTLDQPVPFDHYAFELIESSLSDAAQHRVAIRFISGPLQLHHAIGNVLVLSEAKQDSEVYACFNLVWQPNLAIHQVAYSEAER
jgi:hypothetical protein